MIVLFGGIPCIILWHWHQQMREKYLSSHLRGKSRKKKRSIKKKWYDRSLFQKWEATSDFLSRHPSLLVGQWYQANASTTGLSLDETVSGLTDPSYLPEQSKKCGWKFIQRFFSDAKITCVTTNLNG
jgi:hypothetical protein